MKAPIQRCCKVVSVCLWLGLTSTAAHAGPSVDTAWVDEVWRDHLLWRAKTLAASPNSIYTESFCRDVLQLDPGNREALGLLTQVYAAKGESAMLAMTSLIAIELYPSESFFKHTLEKADERIESRPIGPTDEELAVATNKFSVYFRDAIRTRLVDRNLMISEIEIRTLLTKYPLNVNLLEELSTIYRLAKEWTMCAMVNRLGLRTYPQNQTFLFNYLESLHFIDRDQDAWKLATERLKEQPDSAELMEIVAMLSVATGQEDSAPYFLGLYHAGTGGADGALALGKSLIRKNQLPAAAVVLKFVHEKDPVRPEPVYDLAVVSSVMEDREAAEQWLGTLRGLVDPATYREMVQSGPFPSNIVESTLSR